MGSEGISHGLRVGSWQTKCLQKLNRHFTVGAAPQPSAGRPRRSLRQASVACGGGSPIGDDEYTLTRVRVFSLDGEPLKETAITLTPGGREVEAKDAETVAGLEAIRPLGPDPKWSGEAPFSVLCTRSMGLRSSPP